ncbi:3-hydroxyacyl-CoA dehydrogenase [Chelativorans sp. YIM 93263]|uniref:3-hydroxyacyl-CoA dehydrogenase n=1 Tax=Chelativorans sp. YIM 93263 TaxID=2906648 RepID=UPI0023784BE6|nr:3-hydroxyacyl-CoA dehydrogenase [Chelativorans sp. YIM 93263]
MTHIAIVGAGLIGRSWTFVFARAGMNVTVWDKEPSVLERLEEDLTAMIDMAAAHGRAGGDPAALKSRIEARHALSDALERAELVQESGPEVLEIKQKIFRELDRLSPASAIIASSSSALMASQYAEGLSGCARCLVGHPVNPPHLVPVVELSPGPETATETVDRAEEIYRAAGQVPVRLSREIDGFILNRLQAAILAESLRLISEGIVSAEGLDDTIRHGLGRRWAFMGPMETIALNAPGGIEDYLARYGPMMARLADDCARGEAFTPGAARKIAEHFGEPEPADVRRRQAWRDGELAALDRHLINRRSSGGT